MNIRWANKAVRNYLQMTTDELKGQMCHDIFLGIESLCTHCPVQRSLLSGHPEWDEQVDRYGQNWIIRSYPLRSSDGTIQGILEMPFRVSKSTFLEEIPDLICRFLPDGTLTYVNKAYCSFFDMHEHELVGKNFLELIPENERDVVKKSFQSLSFQNPKRSHEHRVVLSNGEIRWQQWTDCALFDKKGQLFQYQAIGRDITESKEREEELRKGGFYDSLTGLYNRIYFEEQVRHLDEDRHTPAGIIVCEVRDIQHVRNTFGEEAGDNILKAVADKLRETFRSGDIKARIERGKFAVLLQETDEDEVELLQRMLRQSLHDLYSDNTAYSLSVLVGHSVCEGPTSRVILAWYEADENRR